MNTIPKRLIASAATVAAVGGALLAGGGTSSAVLVGSPATGAASVTLYVYFDTFEHPAWCTYRAVPDITKIPYLQGFAPGDAKAYKLVTPRPLPGQNWTVTVSCTQKYGGPNIESQPTTYAV